MEQVFQQLRAACVPLVAANRINDPQQLADASLEHLKRLHASLDATPAYAFSSKLANYAFFPLSQLIERLAVGQRVPGSLATETLLTLVVLVDKWRTCSDGMPPLVQKQLWRLESLLISKWMGPSEDSQLNAALLALQHTVRALEKYPLGPLQMPEVLPVPLGQLVATLRSLLDILDSSAYSESTHTACVQLLGTLIGAYLSRMPESSMDPQQDNLPLNDAVSTSTWLASFMPSILSKLSKLICSPHTSSRLITECIHVENCVFTNVLSDRCTQSIVPTHAPLVSWDSLKEQALQGSQVSTSRLSSQVEQDVSEKDPRDAPLLSKEWLQLTMVRVKQMIKLQRDALVHHGDAHVRSAFAKLLADLVAQSAILFGNDEISHESLLALASDENHLVSDMVQLSPVITPEAAASALDNKVALFSLHVTQDDFRHASQDARLISFLLSKTPQGIPHDSIARHLAKAALLKPGRLTRMLPADVDSWPPMPLEFSRDVRLSASLEDVARALGMWAFAYGKEEDIVQCLVSASPTGATGIWLASAALDGAAARLDPLRKPPKTIRKAAKFLARMALSNLDGVNESMSDVASLDGADLTVSNVHLTLAKDFDVDKQASTDHAEREQDAQVLLDCVSIRALASSVACVSQHVNLASSWFPEALLHLLHRKAPGSPFLIRTCSETALSHIANHLAYISVQDLLSGNVDYVLDIVSQRLMPSHFQPKAPLALAELVKTVGTSILPTATTLIDSLFDALDDLHRNEHVADSIWAVMDALTSLLHYVRNPPLALPQSNDVWASLKPWLVKGAQLGFRNVPLPMYMGLAEKTDADEKLPESNPERPFSEFTKSEMDERFTELNPDSERLNHDSLDSGSADSEKRFADLSEAPTPYEPPAPTLDLSSNIQDGLFLMSRHILSKTTFFLSSESPQLRVHILLIMERLVRFLSTFPEGRRLFLPFIHQAWPYICNRMNVQSNPVSVAFAAVRLVLSLVEEQGDFVAQRFVEDAWPQYAQMLEQMRRGFSSQAEAMVGTVLETLTLATTLNLFNEEIIYDVGIKCRFLLDSKCALQDSAVRLYRELIRANSGTIYYVLALRPAYDECASCDVTRNVRRILST